MADLSELAGARSAHDMPHGAQIVPGGVRFRLWAPACDRISVLVDDVEEAMAPQPGGWHERLSTTARAGSRYQFVLPDGMRVPDPASRSQPDDAHGASEVIDPEAYAWRDGAWRGRPWHEAVIYELHVGTFTPEGGFLSIIDKLDHLISLGVTAIELMPIADFPGERNWGYDGVALYAPDSSYGTPDDLKRLVDAAHARGVMVFLDVVYNHFGPDGNYLPVYAPAIFTDRHKTPWGAGINYDGRSSPAVRDLIIHNALYWIEEFHLDGMRFDAVHAILDDSDVHMLIEMAQRLRAQAGGRELHLILENEESTVAELARSDGNLPVHYTAQWNDDVHHVLHTAITGEDGGYYEDYAGDTQKLGRGLAEGFVYQGEMMPYRGRERGEPSAGLPPGAFVSFIQNHDQVGNRAFGDRLSATVPADRLRAAAAIYLLLPQIPMLFMGEEWGADEPFPFFCDFQGDLAEAIREGRRAEFKRFPEFRDPAKRERIPDPLEEKTFRSAKLDWTALTEAPHADWLTWYRLVLAARHARITPLIPLIGGFAGSFAVLGTGAVCVRWKIDDGRTLMLCTNLSGAKVGGYPEPGEILWHEGPEVDAPHLGAWTVRWSIS